MTFLHYSSSQSNHSLYDPVDSRCEVFFKFPEKQTETKM